MKAQNFFFAVLQTYTFALLPARTTGGINSLPAYSNLNDSSLLSTNSSVVLLGVVLPIHYVNDSGVCDPIYDTTIVRAEAIAYAVNKINSNPTLLPPGVKLVFYVQDSCATLNTALDRTLDFITGKVAIGNAGTLYRASGIIGEAQSSISLAMASLLRLFRIPQVSPYSTAVELSNKLLYEYFFRIPPPDNYQSQALVDLVEYFNWTYIIAVNYGDTYGRNGINKFKEILNARNNTNTKRCIATTIEIPLQSDYDKAAIQREYDNAAKSFAEPWVANASAVVLFGHATTAMSLLDALQRNNVTRRLFWLGSDSWGDSLDGIYPNLVRNLVSLVPKSDTITNFDEYFKSLHISNHTSNPWFGEYWEYKFNCSLKNTTSTYSRTCDTTRQHIENYRQDSFIPLTINAVSSFANAIRALHRSMCNVGGLCKEILTAGDPQSRVYISGELLNKFMFNVKFTSESGAIFTFDKNGDPNTAQYTIRNLQLQDNSFKYVSIGLWSNVNPLAPLNFTQPVVWNNGLESTAVSRCSDMCKSGQYRLFSTDCCWRCVDCPGEKDIGDGVGTRCSQCPSDSSPNQFKNSCMPIAVTYYDAGQPVAIFILVITSLGILATLTVSVIFFVHFNHKLIKATSRELSCFLIAGILLLFATPFLFVIKPSAAVCGIRWILVGVSFSISFSAILLRTIRIHRIFNRPLSMKKPVFLGPLSQFVFALMLIGVQVVILVIWLAIEHPGDKYLYQVASGEVLCSQSPYSAFSVTVAYNCLLLLVTIYFAYRTRHVPKNFNETKFINLTAYSLVIIWVVLLLTYFGTVSLGAYYQTTSLLVAVVLSASVVLGAIFVPRLIYLFRTVHGKVPFHHEATAVNFGMSVQGNSHKLKPIVGKGNCGSYSTISTSDSSTQTE